MPHLRLRQLTNCFRVLLAAAIFANPVWAAEPQLRDLAIDGLKKLKLGQSKEEFVAALGESFNFSPSDIKCGSDSYLGMARIERCFALAGTRSERMGTYASIPVATARAVFQDGRAVRVQLGFGLSTIATQERLTNSLVSALGEPQAKHADQLRWFDRKAVLILLFTGGEFMKSNSWIDLDFMTSGHFMDLMKRLKEDAARSASESLRKKDM